jgi:four helix bundle protein
VTYMVKERDLKARSYKFSLMVISLVDALSMDTSSQVIARQVLRSATSIGANIVEAQASPTRKDFSLFLSHSLKSANETAYWLKLLRDAKKVSADKIDVLINECEELASILGASLVTVRSNGHQ